ncbi:MAG TPA: LytTR family DNA-binding domain-containing protein [Flavobacteriales bacterium]|nr:LytTR family DNA-binding domain-containing protein [Flavobacteriales bacterium]
MFDKINAIIIDDEPIAIKGLAKHVEGISFIEVTGTGENATEAAELLNSKQVDLMFLDINMPTISGLEFLKRLDKKPMTIITSAYPDYALEGYELDVIDYLVKPIGFDRFQKACNKARDFFELTRNAERKVEVDYIFIKCDKKIEKLFYNDILFIEALHNYIAIHTEKGRFVSYMALKGLEEVLPKTTFLKVHKSFVVSVPKVTRIEGNELVIGTKKIPVSRNLKDEIMKSILGGRLVKR